MSFKELIEKVEILVIDVKELIEKLKANPKFNKVSGLSPDEEYVDELHKLAMEDITPTCVKNGDLG